MTRDDHLAWCKRRATEYVQTGDLGGAVASMTSDMKKHPETADIITFLGMIGIMEIRNGAAAVQRWIDGFN
jgi:hypothetical protein